MGQINASFGEASTTLADFCGSFVAIVYGSAGMLAAGAG
jgi:chemotaxis protein CheY-P-specific phosphatase CheC